MGRRLQILLDDERYRSLAAEAESSGRSIAALIREAIDIRANAGAVGRRAAGQRLLDSADPIADPAAPGQPDWSEVKAEIEGELAARLPSP